MSEILGFGACLPRHRLTAGKSGPVRTLAGADEDGLTLAVAAARNALRDAGIGADSIDGVIFATASSPYGEKQSAPIAARALGLRENIVAFDVTGSTRAGTQALFAAADLAQSGQGRRLLVLAGDIREAAPGSARELEFGDAGAAVILGGARGFARIARIEQRSNEMLDVWRTADEPFVHAWENRFIIDHGYKPQIEAVLRTIAAGEGDALAGFSRAAIYAPDLRSLKEVATAVDVKLDTVIGAGWFGSVGCTGASFALLQLCAALEMAKPGEKLLLADYGDGAGAAVITVSAAPPHSADPVPAQIARGKAVDQAWRLKARNLLPKEFEPGGDLGNSATAHFRERDANLTLEGQVCVCGTHQFPKGRICVRCGAADKFKPCRYADRPGKVITYSRDHFFPTPSPPTVITVTELQDGPRIYVQVTDAEPDEITVGTPVQLVFRRIHQIGGRPNYFWKCMPIRGEIS